MRSLNLFIASLKPLSQRYNIPTNPSKPLSGLRVSVVSKKTRITISKTRKGHHRLTMVTLQDERRVVWRWRMAARLFNFYQII
jgi:hypothetical protein